MRKWICRRRIYIHGNSVCHSPSGKARHGASQLAVGSLRLSIYVGEPTGRWQPTFFLLATVDGRAAAGMLEAAIIMHVKYRASSINGCGRTLAEKAHFALRVATHRIPCTPRFVRSGGRWHHV